MSAAARQDSWPRGAGDARRLIALAGECVAAGIGRRVLLLRLSLLPPDRRRPHHLRLAQEALFPLAGAEQAPLFHLPGGDLLVVWRGGGESALRQSLHALHHLFEGDTLPPADLAALTEVLELPRDAEAVLRAAGHAPPSPPPPPGRPLDTAMLATLEAALAQASVDRFARRQPICAITQDGFRLGWERRFLSVAELFATLVPECDAHADPWLFRRLTRLLDRRLLAMLCAPAELRGAAPFALDLNVASILAPAFLRFDALLPAALRGAVVLNLGAADMLSDPAAFLFARDFARARGYRLLLRAHAGHLALLPLATLGLDLLRLRWSDELVAAEPALLPDTHGIVLAGADSAAALAWGRSQGILLYQGLLATPSARLRMRPP